MVLAFILAGLIGACKSDTPKGAETAGAVSDAAGADDASTKLSPEERKTMETGLTQVQKLETEFIQFNRKFEAMREDVKKIPAAHKKNAKDFDQLQANLDQFGQSSEYIKTELAKLIQPLQAKLDPEKFAEAQKGVLMTSDQSVLASNWEDQLGVVERTVIDFGQSLGKVEAAVEKLKNAKGAPVVLFN